MKTDIAVALITFIFTTVSARSPGKRAGLDDDAIHSKAHAGGIAGSDPGPNLPAPLQNQNREPYNRCGRLGFPHSGRCFYCPEGRYAFFSNNEWSCSCSRQTRWDPQLMDCVCEPPYAKSGPRDYECSACVEGWYKSIEYEQLEMNKCITKAERDKELEKIHWVGDRMIFVN